MGNVLSGKLRSGDAGSLRLDYYDPIPDGAGAGAADMAIPMPRDALAEFVHKHSGFHKKDAITYLVAAVISIIPAFAFFLASGTFLDLFSTCLKLNREKKAISNIGDFANLLANGAIGTKSAIVSFNFLKLQARYPFSRNQGFAVQATMAGLSLILIAFASVLNAIQAVLFKDSPDAPPWYANAVIPWMVAVPALVIGIFQLARVSLTVMIPESPEIAAIRELLVNEVVSKLDDGTLQTQVRGVLDIKRQPILARGKLLLAKGVGLSIGLAATAMYALAYIRGTESSLAATGASALEEGALPTLMAYDAAFWKWLFLTMPYFQKIMSTINFAVTQVKVRQQGLSDGYAVYNQDEAPVLIKVFSFLLAAITGGASLGSAAELVDKYLLQEGSQCVPGPGMNTIARPLAIAIAGSWPINTADLADIQERLVTTGIAERRIRSETGIQALLRQDEAGGVSERDRMRVRAARILHEMPECELAQLVASTDEAGDVDTIISQRSSAARAVSAFGGNYSLYAASRVPTAVSERAAYVAKHNYNTRTGFFGKLETVARMIAAPAIGPEGTSSKVVRFTLTPEAEEMLRVAGQGFELN